MLFLVDDFVVKIHLISILYVALPFTFLYLKHDCGSNTSCFKRNVFGNTFCEKAVNKIEIDKSKKEIKKKEEKDGSVNYFAMPS